MTKKVVRAKIRWLSEAEGGRKAPPTGPKYAAPARFGDISDRWPNEAWSLVVEFVEPPDVSLETKASVWLLVGDEPNAPNHLLHLGSRFDLFEGYKLVARGEIVE
jgi:hypothetical protein